MTKKTSMQEKIENTEKTETGEQMALIDVAPENAKVILPEARKYKKLQAIRLTALAKEVAQKQKVLSLIREAKLQRLEDGKIRFKYEGVIIKVTPQDERLTVTEEE